MVVPLDRSQLLAAVERSPQAAAAHDRAGWVGLFTGDGRIEDPVGSRPHVGHEQIGRFYDTFIGPRDIKFHRDLDIVVGRAVLRDLELEVAMGSAATMYIPAFLRYDLRETNGGSAEELSSSLEQLRDMAGGDVPVIHFHGGNSTAKELEAYRDLGVEHLLADLPTEPRDQTLQRLDGLQAELAKLT